MHHCFFLYLSELVITAQFTATYTLPALRFTWPVVFLFLFLFYFFFLHRILSVRHYLGNSFLRRFTGTPAIL